MSFPRQRPRRLRTSAALRSMVRETSLTPTDFILPIFATPGRNQRTEVSSMPGVYQLSVDQVVIEARSAAEAGVPSVILFGLPDTKDALGSSGWSMDGPVARSVAAIKDALPQMLVITDVCMCEYTDHGHCGQLTERRDGRVDVDNDKTLELLAREALCHARAGADVVAPSDMMDGRVAAIRQALDADGFTDLPILSYAAKYASGFYGPFGKAADNAPKQGDRRSYQMDPANAREALKEVRLDLEEGADMVMVKPARYHHQGARALRRPRGCLQRQRGVRDGQGGRTGRLHRRGARHARGADVDQARRCRYDLDLPRHGSRASARRLTLVRDQSMSSAISWIASGWPVPRTIVPTWFFLPAAIQRCA
jgi:porphobilinogen synthase